MTTVAFDGRVMAADSGIGAPCRDVIEFEKIRTVGSAVLGFSGDMLLIEHFIKWYSGSRSELADLGKTEHGLSVLVVDPPQVLFFDESGHRVLQEAPCAIGSGMPIAMGAMLAGASAVEAVEIAIRLDNDSAGPVRSVEIDALKLAVSH